MSSEDTQAFTALALIGFGSLFTMAYLMVYPDSPGFSTFVTFLSFLPVFLSTLAVIYGWATIMWWATS